MRAVFLDREDVREVGVGCDGDPHPGWFVSEVADREVLAHPHADVALSFHEQSAFNAVTPGAGAAEERCVMRCSRNHRQRLDFLSVNEQAPSR